MYRAVMLLLVIKKVYQMWKRLLLCRAVMLLVMKMVYQIVQGGDAAGFHPTATDVS
jgi:hypothetical protein